MSPREIVAVIYNRIDELDFGYESENMPSDTEKAALDIASSLGLITREQRLRYESEERNQRTLERWADRLRLAREWAKLSPEEQARRTSMRESFQAQSKIIQDIYYWNVTHTAFTMPNA